MKFLWTTLHVKNLEESITFYSQIIGLQVVNRFKAGKGVEIAFMGNGVEGETLVELLEDQNHDNVSFGGAVSIGFSITSVEDMMKSLEERNIKIYGGPIETPDAMFFFIKDPSGFTVQLFQYK